MQQVISRFLANLGHAVQCADNAAQAMAQAERQRFDLLLIDTRLPDAEGPELLGMLRQLPNYHEVPAIAISGYGEEQARFARAAGFDRFFSKPIEFDDLQAAIERYGAQRVRVVGS
jgi:CheY-like chemotaxis protein